MSDREIKAIFENNCDTVSCENGAPAISLEAFRNVARSLSSRCYEENCIEQIGVQDEIEKS